jgi:CarD family transcriptional regulator
MRALASSKILEDALKTLTGRARIKRTMWSRRAQEYEAKINSGDLISIAEVVRDLHRASDQPEQSYSERQLYESALDRMARELAAVEKIDRDKAMEKLSVSLAAKRARAEAVAAAAASSAAA